MAEPWPHAEVPVRAAAADGSLHCIRMALLSPGRMCPVPGSSGVVMGPVLGQLGSLHTVMTAATVPQPQLSPGCANQEPPALSTAPRGGEGAEKQSHLYNVSPC